MKHPTRKTRTQGRKPTRPVDAAPLSQADQTLLALFGGPVTPLQMMQRFGIMRLAPIVHNLRADGFKIETRMVQVQNRWGEPCTVAEYWLRDRRRARSLRLQRLRAAARRGRAQA